ncbi:hypothetical protein KIW84_031502 [Lathyrus oleraceus]|uniref:Uncharacterized protein n=1 Tax=Pisum sativum TaxID=3888 RepID=A0A9D5B0E7_PEA|nr:hypothetical protein KIW84_031502 [Pisum sativum]
MESNTSDHTLRYADRYSGSLSNPGRSSDYGAVEVKHQVVEAVYLLQSRDVLDIIPAPGARLQIGEGLNDSVVCAPAKIDSQVVMHEEISPNVHVNCCQVGSNQDSPDPSLPASANESIRHVIHSNASDTFDHGGINLDLVAGPNESEKNRYLQIVSPCLRIWVLNSEKPGEEIAGVLLDLVGDNAFETVQNLLLHRKEIVDSIHYGLSVFKSDTSAANAQSRMPSNGTQVTVQTESGKQIDKLRRKEEKRNRRGIEHAGGDDLSTLDFSSLLQASERKNLVDGMISTGDRAIAVNALPEGTIKKYCKGELDDFAQAAFRGYKSLNRIQSRIFQTVYGTNENILFIYGGAFIDLEKTISDRCQDSSVGFGAPVRTKMKAGSITEAAVASSLLVTVEERFRDSGDFWQRSRSRKQTPCSHQSKYVDSILSKPQQHA